MCAGARIQQLRLNPGDFVGVWMSADQLVYLIWAGFATREKLHWWKRQGVLVDVPATHFAERNHATGALTWDEVPQGMVIRGIVTNEDKLLKVFTRASTPEELERFGHDRMPVLEPPLHSAELPKEAPPKRKGAENKMVQGELW